MTFNITTHFDLPIDRLPGKVKIQNTDDEVIVNFYSNYRGWILDYAETLINGRSIEVFADKNKMPDGTPVFVNNAGYAFLALVNGYFDMIGQLCGSDNDYFDCYREWNGTKHKLKTFKQSTNKIKNWNDWDNPPDKKDHKPETGRCVWYGLTVLFYNEYKKINPKSKSPQTNLDWAKFCYLFYKNTRNPVAHTTFPSKLLITRDPIPNSWVIHKINNKNVPMINLLSWYKTIVEHFDKYMLRVRLPKTPEDGELRIRFLKRRNRLLD